MECKVNRTGTRPFYLCQRKDIIGGIRYSISTMNDGPAILETNVAALLIQIPKAGRVFINHRTACIGCYLARFCSLKDVIGIYSLDENEFVKDIAGLTAQIS